MRVWCDVVQAWQGCECGGMWCRHGKGASVVGCGAGMVRVRVWCESIIDLGSVPPVIMPYLDTNTSGERS